MRLACHFSWQAQHLGMLECHLSWRAQYLVKLQFQLLVAGAAFGKIWIDSLVANVFCIQDACHVLSAKSNLSGRAGQIILASWSDLPGSIWWSWRDVGVPLFTGRLGYLCTMLVSKHTYVVRPKLCRKGTHSPGCTTFLRLGPPSWTGMQMVTRTWSTRTTRTGSSG